MKGYRRALSCYELQHDELCCTNCLVPRLGTLLVGPQCGVHSRGGHIALTLRKLAGLPARVGWAEARPARPSGPARFNPQLNSYNIANWARVRCRTH
eukprot:3875878-Prymnesium_polylepis.1